MRERYDNINALRGISAIGIAMMHYLANLKQTPDMGWIGSELISRFGMLIFLFFIISAFSLCCGYYERIKTGAITPNDFYAKRYKRIFPFFALLCLLDVSLNFSKESLAEAFMNCTLVFNLLPNPDIKVIGVGWFLGTVFVFYMLFPFFVFLLDNKRRAWMVLGISLIINFLCQEYFFKSPFIDSNSYSPKWNILYIAPFLFVGGIIFLYKDQLGICARRKYMLTIAIGVTILYFLLPLSKSSHWNLINLIPLLVVFTLWLIYAIGPRHWWMQNRVMNFLSNISMEIYLCHMVMFRAVEKIHLERFIKDNILLYIVTCIIGIGLTILFSYYVKKWLGKISFSRKTVQPLSA